MINQILFGLVSALKQLLNHRDKQVIIHVDDGIITIYIGKNKEGEERFYGIDLLGIKEINNLSYFQKIIPNISKILYCGDVVYSKYINLIQFYDNELELRYFLNVLREYGQFAMMTVGDSVLVENNSDKSFSIIKDGVVEEMIYGSVDSVMDQLKIYKINLENRKYKIII